ncbi:MAG: 50S ribosomal protein L21 [Candidatus Latescibacteria bacterium]|nr:50S ribosomal protein L21 [Candidatus Latescibacterota bacterium]
MYAIVNIAGSQFKVEKGDVIRVPKLEATIGEHVTFDQVLLTLREEEGTVVGSPTVDRSHIVGKILGHDRAKKVLVFKKKRRKEYKKLNGHRQPYTAVLIEDIVMEGGN